MVNIRPHLVLAALLSVGLALLLPSYSSTAYADDAGTVTIPPMVDARDTPAPPATASSVGSGSDVATAPTPTPPSSSPAMTPDSEDGALAQTLWKAIQSKDWFLAVGAGLALLIHLARWLLKKKWPAFEKDRWGWMLAAGIAGFVAVTTALLAGKDAASSHTVIGAVKIFVAAIATYVSTKKLTSVT